MGGAEMTKIKTYLILVVLFGKIFGGKIWSGGTAQLLPKGRIEIGVFQPLRYGFSETMEFSTYKLSTFLMPNISVKFARNSRFGWSVSTRHGFMYPTPMLKKLQSPLGMELGDPNKFALISPEFDIPQMVSFSNELLASRKTLEGLLVTVKGGVSFAFGSGKLDRSSTIDLPLVFPRLSVYYNKWLIRVGADMSKPVRNSWSYLLDYDLFLMPGGYEAYGFEHKALLIWMKSHRFRILFGYKLTAGEYPFGVQAHLFPLLDFQWAN